MFRYIRNTVILMVCSALIFAGDTEDIKKTIKDDFAYLNKTKRSKNEYSKDGALEFWSSGGLLHRIDESITIMK